jgi:hypothetical protein
MLKEPGQQQRFYFVSFFGFSAIDGFSACHLSPPAETHHEDQNHVWFCLMQQGWHVFWLAGCGARARGNGEPMKCNVGSCSTEYP